MPLCTQEKKLKFFFPKLDDDGVFLLVKRNKLLNNFFEKINFFLKKRQIQASNIYIIILSMSKDMLSIDLYHMAIESN